MDLTNQHTIKELLHKHGIRPSKRLGQNFLVNRRVLEDFLELVDISPNDIIVEVGAGAGTITKELVKHAKRVIAVEKDTRLIPILRETLKDIHNVEIIEGDIRRLPNLESRISNLESSKFKIQNSKFKLVGNLPFYLTNFLIRSFLESEHPPTAMTLVVQKEVGERICAKPPHMNILAVAVQYYGNPKIITRIPRSSFWPQPEVEGAILMIAPLRTANTNTKNREMFFKLIRAGFSHPRKYLLRNLSSGLNLIQEIVEKEFGLLGLKLTARPQELPLEDWEKLSLVFTKYLGTKIPHGIPRS